MNPSSPLFPLVFLAFSAVVALVADRIGILIGRVLLRRRQARS